jgi:hypothetical protein
MEMRGTGVLHKARVIHRKVGQIGSPVSQIVYIACQLNLAAFSEHEKLFASILDERGPKSTPGVISAAKPEELYATVDTRTFMEQPAGPNTTQFKLLAKP